MRYQRQIPGGAFVNESFDKQRQIPGSVFFNEVLWSFDEAILPNAVTLTNLTGAYTNITDDPSAPDANWLTVP